MLFAARERAQHKHEHNTFQLLLALNTPKVPGRPFETATAATAATVRHLSQC